MVTDKIGSDYTLNIPDAFRDVFSAGQEVAISSDEQGRLVITPVDFVRERLLETFGMWAERADMPRDSVDYVDELRRDRRLEVMETHIDEAD